MDRQTKKLIGTFKIGNRVETVAEDGSHCLSKITNGLVGTIQEIHDFGNRPIYVRFDGGERGCFHKGELKRI